MYFWSRRPLCFPATRGNQIYIFLDMVLFPLASLRVLSIHMSHRLLLFFHFWFQWKIRMKTMKLEHFKCLIRPTKSWWYHVHEISSRVSGSLYTRYNKQLPGYNLVSALITAKSAYYKASKREARFILVWYRLSKTTVTVMDTKWYYIRIVYNTVFKDRLRSQIMRVWTYRIMNSNQKRSMYCHKSLFKQKRWQCSSLACHGAI